MHTRQMMWMAVWLVAACRWGIAQESWQSRVERLPVSVGENLIVTLRPGESWVDIGTRHFVGYEHLRRANAGNIASARRLFIPGRHQVPALTATGLVINLPELMNFRWEDGRVTAWYPISIGRITSRWRTPTGNLKVVNRERDPVWNQPVWAGGGKVPPGPRNPLGDRWIGLNRPGYGLHGTNDPTSIGRFVSHGCIRHFPAHIHRLFDATRVGMPVIITYQTVTVGLDDGIIYMAVFPDVYGRGTNAPGKAKARLASFGLDGALTAGELSQRLARADGIARPLLGSKTKVTVNLTALDLPLGPSRKGGSYYLPARAIADALGAQVGWDGGSRRLTLSSEDRHASFAAGSEAFHALGTYFVPVRPAVQGLGGAVLFTRGHIRIFSL